MQKKSKSGFNVKRHIVAAVVLPFFIAYIYLLPPLPYFLAFLLIIAMTAMWEFFVMYSVPARLYVPGVLIGGLLFYVCCRYPEYYFHVSLGGLFLLLLLRLFFAAAPSGCMSEIGPLSAGFMYIAGLLSFQWFLRETDLGLKYIFLLYISVWFSDSAAYYIGTSMGKNKLSPKISPNKTVEGAFGSVFGGVLGTLLAKFIFSIPGLSMGAAILIGATMGVTAMIGDLIESMFKRDAGVKDSSSFIPGHGGILDKLDGMLVSGPVLYFIVKYMYA